MTCCITSVLFGFFCDLDELLKIMNRFYKRKEMQKLAADHGLDGEENLFRDGNKVFSKKQNFMLSLFTK